MKHTLGPERGPIPLPQLPPTARTRIMHLLAGVAALVLLLHALIHLLGTAAYLRLAVIPQLPYTTTVLSGRWEIGARGIALYGALWAVAAIGFSFATGALLAGWPAWKPVLFGVTLLSLALTSLVWDDASTGFFLNIAILALLGLEPRLRRWGAAQR